MSLSLLLGKCLLSPFGVEIEPQGLYISAEFSEGEKVLFVTEGKDTLLGKGIFGENVERERTGQTL